VPRRVPTGHHGLAPLPALFGGSAIPRVPTGHTWRRRCTHSCEESRIWVTIGEKKAGSIPARSCTGEPARPLAPSPRAVSPVPWTRSPGVPDCPVSAPKVLLARFDRVASRSSTTRPALRVAGTALGRLVTAVGSKDSICLTIRAPPDHCPP
jgi:hypothetical protein